MKSLGPDEQVIVGEAVSGLGFPFNGGIRACSSQLVGRWAVLILYARRVAPCSLHLGFRGTEEHTDDAATLLMLQACIRD